MEVAARRIVVAPIREVRRIAAALQIRDRVREVVIVVDHRTLAEVVAAIAHQLRVRAIREADNFNA